MKTAAKGIFYGGRGESKADVRPVHQARFVNVVRAPFS